MLGFPDDTIDFTGINYNSPTIQAMMGGMNNIPPSPVGGPIVINGVEYVHDPSLLQYAYDTPIYQQQPYGGYQQQAYQPQAQMPIQQQVNGSMPLEEQIFGMQNTINIQSQQSQQNAAMYQSMLQYQPPYSVPTMQVYQQPMMPQGMFPMNPPYGYQQPIYQPMVYQQPGMAGYYNDQSRFLNPYLEQQYNNRCQAILAEQQRKQSDMMKMLSNIVHEGLGDKEEIEDFDGFLSRQYDPPEIDKEYYEELLHYNKLCSIVPYPETNYVYLAYAAKIREEYQKDFPPTMGLFEYLENAGTLVQQCYEDRAKQIITNGKKQYDSDHFKDIVHANPKSREASIYFNSAILGKGKATLTGDSVIANIDDMEITYPLGGGQPSIVVTAPDFIKKYDDRRQAFFESITGGKH